MTSCSIAAAAVAFAMGMKRPVSCSTIISSAPPWAVDTTGFPAAMASSTTVGKGSGNTDATTNRSIDSMNAGTSSV